MKTNTQDVILAVATLLIAIVLLFFPFMAGATGTQKPKPAAPSTSAATQTQSQHAAASTGAIDLSLMNNPVVGDVSMRGGNSYSLVSGAAPLPPGLCPKGESVSVLFGMFAWSKTATEHECLDKVLAYAREAIPKAPVTNYITNYTSAPENAECPVAVKPTARKKPPSTPSSATQGAGTCK